MDNFHVSSTSSHRMPEPAFGMLALMLYFFLVVLLMSGCASKGSVSGSDGPNAITRPSNCQSEERLGITIEGLSLSAAGNMLDLRYRVNDSEKAALMFDRKIRPYLLDEKSGAAFGVPESPKVGQIRTTRRNADPAAERAYHILFANPGHLLQAGQKVSLVIGEVKLEDIVVQ